MRCITGKKRTTIPHTHTMSVDPRTQRVDLPLGNVNGRAVLRVFEPMR
jgi:hypothetical protein